jgi:hypothetical protein
MKIYFERSGGFAGMRTAISLDTDSLAPDESKQLTQIYEKTDFFNLSSKTEPPKGADYFHYKITVELENKIHTIETTEISDPSLGMFINFLSNKALQTKQN